MAIGVSFTGYDGKKIESVAQDTNDLLRIMGEKNGPLLGAAYTFGGKSKPKESIKQVSMNINKTVQNMMGTQKKPDPVDGPVCGRANSGSTEPDGAYRAVGTKGGFRIVVSRTEEKYEPCQEMLCDKVTLVKLEFDLIFSEEGLCKGRSAERKVWEKSFFVMKENQEEEEGSGSGTYCVRAFWEQETTDMPHLNALAFGSDSNLSTYNSKIGDFGANYEDEEMTKKKAEPPVKIITTAQCNA